MTKTLHGKVHGKTIELDEDPGVAEGQAVEGGAQGRQLGRRHPALGGRLGELPGNGCHHRENPAAAKAGKRSFLLIFYSMFKSSASNCRSSAEDPSATPCLASEKPNVATKRRVSGRRRHSVGFWVFGSVA